MEHQEFDELSRALATTGSRRKAAGALAGLLGLHVLGSTAQGESKQKRRRQRRRNKQDRRKQNRRGLSHGILRGNRFIVGNPNTNQQAFNVEFGYTNKGLSCCQGQAAYTLEPGRSEEFTTEEADAYLWVEDRYFLWAHNTLVAEPELYWATNGVTANFSPHCCKPTGQYRGHQFMDVDETKVVDFQGRPISVQRLPDDDDYKVFSITL